MRSQEKGEGEEKEDRRKERKEGGRGASRENEHEGSRTAVRYARPASHKDGISASFDDSYVVPTTLDGNTADAQSYASDVSVLLPLPAPAGVATHGKFVARTAGHEDSTSVFRDDLSAVSDVLQGNTSDVPLSFTSRCTDENDAAPGVPGNVPGALVDPSCASDGIEVHLTTVRLGTRPSQQYGHRAYCSYFARRRVSGKPSSSTSPLPIFIPPPQHAADTSSPSLDISHGAFSVDVHEARTSVLAAVHHISDSHSGVPGEPLGSTGRSYSPSISPRAMHTSSPPPEVHTADSRDARDAPSSMLAATPQTPVLTYTRLPPRLVDSTTSVELEAPTAGYLTGVASPHNGLANEPRGVTTHDVSGVQTSTTGASYTLMQPPRST
ncbi:uncharacterized protein B0H18DRAFT_1132040 [Fomitopsis serialis]|uniref:uncharacterized protein n=1 Tax=Fomitopsis serialis TaxID=139415 RepID=UPI002007F719|nr:uncharacterized protein B0H18DRAFT_1132040 [Neoantrodia serialis]KAH9906089.1 hypothetical protein B0H18DRAFT_1132040 [Neoantrodia serialis]